MEDERTEKNITAFLSVITRIHLMLVIGLLLFIIVVPLQRNSYNIKWFDFDNNFYYIVPIASILGIIVGQLLYKARKTIALAKDNLTEKLVGLQGAYTAKFMLIEVPAFSGVVGYVFSGNYLYILMIVAMLLYLYLQKPNKEKIRSELN